MADALSQNVRLELSTSDVYRVNPLDRDSGGRGDGERFDRFMKKKGEEEALAGAEEKATPKAVPAIEDGVTLSEPAKAVLGGGQALAAPPDDAPAAAGDPAPAANPPELTPHADSPPPGTRINLIA
jgi:hypothetical protein